MAPGREFKKGVPISNKSLDGQLRRNLFFRVFFIFKNNNNNERKF
jgi:hypothetical protein